MKLITTIKKEGDGGVLYGDQPNVLTRSNHSYSPFHSHKGSLKICTFHNDTKKTETSKKYFKEVIIGGGGWMMRQKERIKKKKLTCLKF